MRKHLALIVEHEDESQVGGVVFYDRPKARLSKNEATPIQQIDEDKKGFAVVGKEVSVGYVDFDSEKDYKNWPLENLHNKLKEIDDEWLIQAGIDEIVLTNEDSDNQ